MVTQTHVNVRRELTDSELSTCDRITRADVGTGSEHSQVSGVAVCA